MDYWNKEDNKSYRSLVKEGKKYTEIKDIMCERLKLNSKFITNFSNFILEV